MSCDFEIRSRTFVETGENFSWSCHAVFERSCFHNEQTNKQKKRHKTPKKPTLSFLSCLDDFCHHRHYCHLSWKFIMNAEMLFVQMFLKRWLRNAVPTWLCLLKLHTQWYIPFVLMLIGLDVREVSVIAVFTVMWLVLLITRLVWRLCWQYVLARCILLLKLIRFLI